MGRRAWPTLRSVKAARTANLQAFFHAHHCRSARRISASIAAIREAASLTEDPPIIAPCRLHVLPLTDTCQRLISLDHKPGQNEDALKRLRQGPLSC
jgi:hypothetical protein